jgi:IS30 family transposase
LEREERLPQLKTITFDNDQAFSHHEKIAKELCIKSYFIRRYTSQDKGTIEYRNGVIRQFFPKRADFNLIENSEVKRVENEFIIDQ